MKRKQTVCKIWIIRIRWVEFKVSINTLSLGSETIIADNLSTGAKRPALFDIDISSNIPFQIRFVFWDTVVDYCVYIRCCNTFDRKYDCRRTDDEHVEFVNAYICVTTVVCSDSACRHYLLTVVVAVVSAVLLGVVIVIIVTIVVCCRKFKLVQRRSGQSVSWGVGLPT